MSKARGRGTLPLEFLADASPDTKDRIRDLLRTAGIRMRTEEGRLAFRSDPSPPSMVTTKSLQRKDNGALRADAFKTLHTGLLSDEDAKDAADWFRSRYEAFIPDSSGKAAKMLPTSFDALQMELLWNLDELPIVEKWTQEEWNAQVTIHRVITTRALHVRDLFWRLARAHLGEGLSLQAMIDSGQWPQLGQISGTVVVQSGVWLVATMAARVQPFAAAFTTVRGAELVAIPKGGWNRDIYQPLMWPVGFGGLRLSGSGVDAYAREGDATIPHSTARELFDAQSDGLNRLLLTLTDPGVWTKPNGELDVEERNIAWATINLGMSSIKDIAQLWGTDASIWAAFRALDILAGYWTAPGGSDVRIGQLVTPATVSEFATPNIKPKWLGEWSRDVVDNWESVLSEMYPDSSVNEAARAVQELRNLLHGVGATPTRARPRGARLMALSSTGKYNLQIVRDLATMWWTALLQNPESHARIGNPPF